MKNSKTLSVSASLYIFIHVRTSKISVIAAQRRLPECTILKEEHFLSDSGILARGMVIKKGGYLRTYDNIQRNKDKNNGRKMRIFITKFENSFIE